MKVKIDRAPGGWYFYASRDPSLPDDVRSELLDSYPAAKRKAQELGHSVDAGGWAHRLLLWNWHNHELDGFPEWEIERDKTPAFAELTHTRGPEGSAVESHVIAVAWDDVAEVDFYQRDKTDDGIPFVAPGGKYRSLWWFQTIAERDRFVIWAARGQRTRTENCATCAGNPRRTPSGTTCKECGLEGTQPWGG